MEGCRLRPNSKVTMWMVRINRQSGSSYRGTDHQVGMQGDRCVHCGIWIDYLSLSDHSFSQFLSFSFSMFLFPSLFRCLSYAFVCLSVVFSFSLSDSGVGFFVFHSLNETEHGNPKGIQ